jgi:hypothetical protein
MMNVALPSSPHVSSNTPNSLPTFPAGPTSLSSRKGSLIFSAHARFFAGGSTEMPTTSAFSASNSLLSSRYRVNSCVHPGESAFR